MIFAIGAPGSPVRSYFDTEDVDRAVGQCLDGEIAIEVSEKLRWASIAGDGASVIPGEAPRDWHLDEIRIRRTALLSRCDWTMVPDSPISEARKEEWRLYRQMLRELPASQPFATLETVEWPIEPEA